MRCVVKALSLVVLIVSAPAIAWSQAVIAGVVRDSSGSVLPGVTVEATSPVLIEKVRSAITDGSGQYRVEDLRPGTYVVTFSLDGFSALRREGIELTGSFTATINVELAVGALNETIVVTGESPIVDVQSAQTQVSLSADVARSIPTTRSYNGFVALIPGVITQALNNDVPVGPVVTMFPIHGGRDVEGRLTVDGLVISNPPGGNQPPNYSADVGNAEEVSFTTAGALGEMETGGLTMNIVPKTGGNAVKGSVYFSGSGEALQSSNFTAALRAAGLQEPTPLTKLYDVSGAVGGPIKRDKIWYFANARVQGSRRVNANQFYNLNAGDPTKWLYAPDFTKPGFTDQTFDNTSARITWQVTPRHKVSVFWDEQAICRSCEGSPTSRAVIASPEGTAIAKQKPFRVRQATWSSPMSNRVLLDAGIGSTYYEYGNYDRTPSTQNLIRVVEQCAGGCAANGNIPNLNYRSAELQDNVTAGYNWRSSASYVTGAHSLKVGYQGNYFIDDRKYIANDRDLTYRVNNGVPNQLTMSASQPQLARAVTHALYLQEQWTMGRLTLQGALRYDRARNWFPPQQVGPSRFVPTAIVFPETKGVDSYQDITPRMGAAYDLFGNRRTAIKASLGKYLLGVSTGQPLTFYNTNPVLRLANTNRLFTNIGVQRSWTDANRNFEPDCDLLNPLAQDLRAGGGDFCGQLSDLAFGKPILTGNLDPDVLQGWGIRPSDWSMSVAVQQQLLPRASVEVAYHRRWFQDFNVTDNLALGSSDFDKYSITAPSDPRLPGGGGYVIPDLYDVVPGKFGQINNLLTLANKYGAWTEHFNGVDVTLSVRTRGGFTFQGGTSTGQSIADTCAVRAVLPELTALTPTGIGPGNLMSGVSPVDPRCRYATGVLTQFRALSAYVVPKIDVQVSGTYQNKPGAQIAANYAVPSAVVAQSLGRPLSGNVPNVTVNLIEPGTLYGERITQLDLRIAKILRFGGTQTTVGADVYNAMNVNTVLVYNPVFVPGGNWQQPRNVMSGRLIRISAEMAF